MMVRFTSYVAQKVADLIVSLVSHHNNERYFSVTASRGKSRKFTQGKMAVTWYRRSEHDVVFSYRKTL